MFLTSVAVRMRRWLAARALRLVAALSPGRDAAGRLARALDGRGPLRRFRDALYRERGELVDEWWAFADARGEHRAVDWLEGEGLVAEDDADDWRATHAVPLPTGDPDTARAVAVRVATLLRQELGSPLLRVVLYGLQARGDADDESDIDLLAVVRQPVDRDAVEAALDEPLWQLLLETGRVVSVVAATEATAARPLPLFLKVSREGLIVG